MNKKIIINFSIKDFSQELENKILDFLKQKLKGLYSSIEVIFKEPYEKFEDENITTWRLMINFFKEISVRECAKMLGDQWIINEGFARSAYPPYEQLNDDEAIWTVMIHRDVFIDSAVIGIRIYEYWDLTDTIKE